MRDSKLYQNTWLLRSGENILHFRDENIVKRLGDIPTVTQLIMVGTSKSKDLHVKRFMY